MKIFRFIFLALIVASTAGCDKTEEDPSVSIDDLVGSWKATSFVFTSKSDASEVTDLIALGGEFRFTMLEGGEVRSWITLDTYSDEWDSQAVITNGNILTLTPVETERGTSTSEIVLDNNTLELTNNNNSFDFTLSGEAEIPAISVALFERD